MIALDTNVIVRYLTQDDPRQASAATKLIESFSSDAPGFITTTVILELVWVLESSYRVQRKEIIRTLEMLLRSKELIIERAEVIWQALRGFAAGKADFADFLIERCGHAADCQYTATFDRNAAASAGMRLLA
jgi:predicted nucleic-acid-binding protein